MASTAPRLPVPSSVARSGVRARFLAWVALALALLLLVHAPLSDAAGRWVDVALALVAIAALVAAAAAMERALRASEQELARLRATLLAHHRENAIGQVVAAAAHDIKNPLTVALGFAELARSLAEETRAMPAKLVRWLKDVEHECQRTSQLINDLLQFARGEEQELLPRKTNDWVRAAVALVKPQIRLKGALCIEELAEDAGDVLGDHLQLRYMLLNVLLNARDAVKEGGRVVVRTRRLEREVEVRVEDDGPGIPAALKARLFEPYVSGRDSGAGLGLSVSREIARAHGGSISVEDGAPHGTVVTIRLPLATAEIMPAAQAAGARSVGSG